MIVEQTKEGILIKTTDPVNSRIIQKIIEYVNVLEIALQSKGTAKQAAKLSDEIDAKWWRENKCRFL